MLLPNPTAERFTPMFQERVVTLKVRSTIHFELNFVPGMNQGDNFFCMSYSIVPATFGDKTKFLTLL